MKLDIDCVRDILLTIEEETDFETMFGYLKDEVDKYPYLRKYSHDQIIYHISQCDKSNLIDSVRYTDNGDFTMIDDLSPLGHEFLANIRSDDIWPGVKAVSQKVGSSSLSAIAQIASSVVTQIIKSQFGLV